MCDSVVFAPYLTSRPDRIGWFDDSHDSGNFDRKSLLTLGVVERNGDAAGSADHPTFVEPVVVTG
jgi:hypothetical protein